MTGVPKTIACDRCKHTQQIEGAESTWTCRYCKAENATKAPDEKTGYTIKTKVGEVETLAPESQGVADTSDPPE